MRDYAHAAVDCGADVVIAHGPHDHLLPIESRAGRPMFYNLGALAFRHGPKGKTFHDWLGLLVRFSHDGSTGASSFSFVRQGNDLTITISEPDQEPEALACPTESCANLGVSLTVAGDRVKVAAH